jgi:hypothetical protein
VHVPHSSRAEQPSPIRPQYCPPIGVQVTGVHPSPVPLSTVKIGPESASEPASAGEASELASLAEPSSCRTRSVLSWPLEQAEITKMDQQHHQRSGYDDMDSDLAEALEWTLRVCPCASTAHRTTTATLTISRAIPRQKVDFARQHPI